MSLLIAGSIATDHLMSFGGKFADSLVVDQLDKLSVSFLVEDLEIRRGGCAGNICFGLGPARPAPGPGRLRGQGLRRLPLLAGAARRRLRLGAHLRGPAHGPLRLHDRRDDGAVRQLLPGRDERGPADRAGPDRRARGRADLRAGRPGRPARGWSATPRSAAQRGYAFIADPSQQLAFGEGEMIRELVDGAAYLFSNEYESHLIESKTGWTADEILERVGTQVITLGPDGVRIVGRDQETIEVPAVPGRGTRWSRPASATRSGPASWRRWSGGSRTSARPRSAACWRRTSSSRSARRSTASRTSSSWSDSLRAYGDEAAADVRPHLLSG